MGYSPASAIPLNTFGAPTGNISMNSHKFTSLLDGSVTGDTAGWDQLPVLTNQYAYVASGLIWTADAPNSTLVASMTAGTVVVNGLLYSVGAVTSRSFTASSETYVDINISAGAAVINYTVVPNNTTSPALVSSGTVFNTVRIAVVTTTASVIVSNLAGIMQGQNAQAGAGALLSTTVAAGSNTHAWNATPLNVAAITNAPSGGGFALITHAAAINIIQFTGTAAGQLTGVTGINGGGLGTPLSTGDTVQGICWFGRSDMIGIPIYPTSPFPSVIGTAQFGATFTSTLTSGTGAFMGNSTNPFTVPFLIPTGGPDRLVRLITSLAGATSSATAGTSCTISNTADNNASALGVQQFKVAVTSDGQGMNVVGTSKPLAPGTYYGATVFTQGAAGTLTLGAAYVNSTFTVEFV